jgi:hypothetical protein
LVVLMLIVAAPYANVAYVVARPRLASRGFARGLSITTAAIGTLIPLTSALMLVSIMSQWTEHPSGVQRAGQMLGAISIVPVTFLMRHVRPLHVSATMATAFLLANAWLATTARMSRVDRARLGDEQVRAWDTVGDLAFYAGWSYLSC